MEKSTFYQAISSVYMVSLFKADKRRRSLTATLKVVEEILTVTFITERLVVIGYSHPLHHNQFILHLASKTGSLACFSVFVQGVLTMFAFSLS